MLDSGVRLAAASLPVGVPVVVGLVVAVLRRRDLPAVSTPAIAGLAVQLVVVLISTFLVAATSFDAFGLTPETLLPLSSVLGFVVILLQVVSWTLLLLALFRRLPGTAAAATPATPQRDDRTPTGRHALLDDRGHQVVAEAGTTFLPVGAAAGAAGAGVGLGAVAAKAPDAGPRPGQGPGPRPMTGPPAGPPRGVPHGPPSGPPSGPPFGQPFGTSPGTPPGPPPGEATSAESSPLPSVPLPVQDDSAQDEPAQDEPAEDVPDQDEPAETETFAAYGVPAAPEQPVEEGGEDDEAPEQVVTDEEDEAVDADETVDPADEHDAGPDEDDEPATTEHHGFVEEVTPTADTPETDAPGEDVDEEPVADADPELVDEPEDTVPAETPDENAPSDGSGTGVHEGQAPPTTGNGASGGHPWFDPDGEAARSQETRSQPERR